jgi:hypothetical protein
MEHLFGVGDAPANKEVNESSSICTANESRVFFCPHFYGDPVQYMANLIKFKSTMIDRQWPSF